MTIITVRARYENGRFVLKTPLDLANGTVVEITVIRLVSEQEADSNKNPQAEAMSKQDRDTPSAAGNSENQAGE